MLLDVEHRQVRSSIFCANISTDMPWSTFNRIVQNAAQVCFSPPLGKCLNIIENIEGLSLVDTSFAPRDSLRPVTFFLAMSPHPLSLVMGVKYSLFDEILRAVFMWERVSFFSLEPACMLL